MLSRLEAIFKTETEALPSEVLAGKVYRRPPVKGDVHGETGNHEFSSKLSHYCSAESSAAVIVVESESHTRSYIEVEISGATEMEVIDSAKMETT